MLKVEQILDFVGNLVYGTADSLYVANNQFWRATAAISRVRPPENTDIYKFALPPTGKPDCSRRKSVPPFAVGASVHVTTVSTPSDAHE